MGEKRNDYIDYILKWENKDIILSKIHRQCFRDNSYPPDSEFQLELIPETKEKCYIFTWETGMAPPDMEIDIVIDRNTPSDLEGKFPKKRHLHRHDFFEILYV